MILAPVGTKEFDGESGTSVGQTTLASFQIPASSTVDYSLSAEIGQLPLPLPYASVRIEYSGAPGSVIAQVSSVDETQDLVVDARTMNEGDGWAGSGSNPWHLDSQTDSILFLTNESDQTARIGFHVVANGVTYYLTSLKLNPRETRAINIRKLRDAQNADFLKNRIPADASDGSVEWNRIDNVAVTGRVVVIQKNQGTASAYDCCMCPCPESYYGLSVTPSPSSFLIPGGVVLVIATGAYRACNHGPTDYLDVSWEATYVSLNPSVAYINPNEYGEVVGASGGTSTISVSWSDYIYTFNGSSCSGSLSPHTVYATVTVVQITGQSVVWWFNGQTPSGYTTTVTLTALPSGGSLYSWQFTAGSSKASFSNQSGNTINVKGSALSTSVNDVGIKVTVTTSTGTGPSGPFNMTVKGPYKLVPSGVNDLTDATYASHSTLNYSVQDNMGQLLPSTVYINEYWTTSVVPDYAGTNWRPTAAGSYSMSNSTFADGIYGEASTFTPTPSPPQSPRSTTKVDHWGQAWYVGSATSGLGARVQTDTIQKYIDHARHESITSPAP